MDARVGQAYGTVIAMLAAAIPLLVFTVDVGREGEPGVVLRTPPLPAPWTSRDLRYCHHEGCRGPDVSAPDHDGTTCSECGEPLHSMSSAEKRQLPGDTRFLKARHAKADGPVLYSAIVLSGQEQDSIHRPQRCLVAQGYQIVGSRVVSVPIQGRTPLKVMLLDTDLPTATPTGATEHYTGYYAYWFLAPGHETPYHLVRLFWLGWNRLVHGETDRWAYLSVSSSRSSDDPSLFLQDLGAFLADWYPGVVRPSGTVREGAHAAENPPSPGRNRTSR